METQTEIEDTTESLFDEDDVELEESKHIQLCEIAIKDLKSMLNILKMDCTTFFELKDGKLRLFNINSPRILIAQFIIYVNSELNRKGQLKLNAFPKTFNRCKKILLSIQADLKKFVLSWEEDDIYSERLLSIEDEFCDEKDLPIKQLLAIKMDYSFQMNPKQIDRLINKNEDGVELKLYRNIVVLSLESGDKRFKTLVTGKKLQQFKANFTCRYLDYFAYFSAFGTCQLSTGVDSPLIIAFKNETISGVMFIAPRIEADQQMEDD